MMGAALGQAVDAFPAFREQVIGALRSARQAHVATRIFVLHDVARGDPLKWLDDTTRSVLSLPLLDLASHKRPRLIELDCRRSAPYLLETDPALDDPWLEASVSHAYQDDTPRRAVCGWLATIDPAIIVARRFVLAERHLAAPVSGHWSWSDPAKVVHLWETLSPAQRGSLLGPNTTWIGLDALGRLHTFAAHSAANPVSQPAPLTSLQLGRARRAKLADRLLDNWHASGRPVPEDAIRRLHERLEHPLADGLDGPDLAAFALTTVELADSFAMDSRWLTTMRTPRAAGGLGDALLELPADAWTDHPYVDRPVMETSR